MARFWWLMMFFSAALAQGRWFEVQIGGKPAGRAREVVGPAHRPRLRTGLAPAGGQLRGQPGAAGGPGAGHAARGLASGAALK